MGKKRLQIATKSSGEAMRWAELKEGGIARGPGDDGNHFDFSLSQETDEYMAARKIVKRLVDRGCCVCEANAPHDLLSAASTEAKELWESGAFGPPIHIYNTETEFEAQMWQNLYKDEEKVCWINPDSEAVTQMNALQLLSQNLFEFAEGLAELIASEPIGVRFTHVGNAMLSCYTGDRSYNLHIDNPHADSSSSGALPDNGLRLTLSYYINPYWNPDSGDNCGGLDVFLTDPKTTPSSGAAARKAQKLRVAPHADSLVVLLSERMAHQVISTKGKEKWFALTVWCWDQRAMETYCARVQAIREQREREQADSSEED